MKGSKTAETLTQFRGILTSLQKPTPALAKALADMGFSSSESAIRTLGLTGVLKGLTDSTGGSAESLAALFPNVRALGGQTSLAADDFKTLTKNINEMTAAGANLSKEKFAAVIQSDAEKLTKEINKLKNALTVELGQSVLKTGVDLSNLAGGADNVTAAAKALGPVLVGTAASFAIFKAGAFSGNAELGRFLGLLSLLPAAHGAGVSLGNFIGDKLAENRNKELNALIKQQAVDLEAFKAAQAEKIEASEITTDAQVKAALHTAQALNRVYLQDVANARSANASLVANTTAGLDKILSARENLVSALAKGAADSRTVAKDSRGRQTDLSDRANDRQFDDSTKRLSDAGQVFALTKRAQELASKAASDLLATGKSGDTDAISRAAAAFQKAQGLGESAAQIGERAGSRQLEALAAKGLAEITQRQIAAEQQLQGLQTQRAAALDSERKKQQSIVDEIRKQVGVVTANTSQFDANGNQFNEVDQSKRAALRAAALRKISESALSQKDLSAQGALGIADFISRNEAALSRDPINLAFSVEKSAAKIQADLQKSFSTFRLGLNLDPLESALGKKQGSTSPDQAASLLAEGKAKADALKRQIEEAATGGEQGKQIQSQLDKVFEKIDARAGNRKLFGDADKQLLDSFGAVGSKTDFPDYEDSREEQQQRYQESRFHVHSPYLKDAAQRQR